MGAENNKSSDDYKLPEISSNYLEDRQFWDFPLVNNIIREYPGMGKTEFKELIAFSFATIFCDKTQPITEEEKKKGVTIGLPIKTLAKLMGYSTEVVDEQGNKKEAKHFYREIKNATERLRKTTSLIENSDKTGFLVYGPVDRAEYNLNKSGMVYATLSPDYIKRLLNQYSPSTIQSLLMFNMMDEEGGFASSRVYQLLSTYYTQAESSREGKFSIALDYVDLRCQLNMINTNDEGVRDILKNDMYMDYSKNVDVAYRRLQAINSLDDVRKANIKNFKESYEYLHKDELDKEKKQKVMATLKELKDNLAVTYENYNNFDKRVLTPAKAGMFNLYKRDNRDLIKFQFDYEPIRYHGVVVRILFTIYTMDAYIQKVANEELKKNENRQISFQFDEDKNLRIDPESLVAGEVKKIDKMPEASPYSKKKQLEEATFDAFNAYYNSLPEDDKVGLSLYDLLNIAKEGNIEVIKANYELLLDNLRKGSQIGVNGNYVGWLISAVRKNYAGNVHKRSYPQKDSSKGRRTANSFNGFQQNDYDFEELEKKLIRNY